MAREDIAPVPQDVRWQLNDDLRDKQLSALDDNARFIVRRMVTQAYARGFDNGWMAGQHDAATDRAIARDRESQTRAEGDQT